MTDAVVTLSVWSALGEEHRPAASEQGPRISERLAARLGLAYLSFAVPELNVTGKPHSPVVRLMGRGEFQAMRGSTPTTDSDPLVWVVEAQGSWRTGGIVPKNRRQDLSVGLVAFDADTGRRYGAFHGNISLLGTPGGSRPSTPTPEPTKVQIRPAGPTPTPVREQARTPGPRWPTATPTNVQIIDLAPHLPDEDKVDVVVKTSSGERYRYRIDPEVYPRSLLGEGDRVAKIVPPKSIMGNYPPRPTPKPPPPPKSTPSPPPNIPDLAQDTVSSEEREEVKARRGPPPWGPHTAGSVIQIAGHQLQLPSDVYVEAIVSEILCIAGEPCPVAPLYVLLRGDSLASIEKRTGRFAPGTPVSTMETFDFIEKALR